jgi:nicotinamide riboside transporter PnuC
MIGKIVVKFMDVILNISSGLLLIIGTIAGGLYADSMSADVTTGAVLGFVVSFIFVVVVFGIAFLALEINNNLIRLNEKVAKANEKDLEVTSN